MSPLSLMTASPCPPRLWKWWDMYLQPSTELFPQVELDLAALLHVDQVSPVLRDPQLLQQTVLCVGPCPPTTTTTTTTPSGLVVVSTKGGGDSGDVTAGQTGNKFH